MFVLQRVTVFSSTSLTPLWKLAAADCLHGKIDAVQAQQHAYAYHISSGWSVAKGWQFAVYPKQQTSPSLPFSFDSLPVSLNCLMLNSNFLFLSSGTLAAIRLLVCSCHLFFLHLSLCQWYQPSTIHLFTPPTNKHLLFCFSAAPNLCTDFLNSASCCDAYRKKAKLKCLDWEVTSYSWQVFNKIKPKINPPEKKGQYNSL